MGRVAEMQRDLMGRVAEDGVRPNQKCSLERDEYLGEGPAQQRAVW